MAVRPVFVPTSGERLLVKEVDFEFSWNAGFAAIQKRKNVLALHRAASAQGLEPILEVSTKSETELGVHLSAFNLHVEMEDRGDIPLESAYQGSKVFSAGGPFHDIYSMSSKDARKDERIRNSGRLVGFRFGRINFPSVPYTAFYDWLYVRALAPHREYLKRLNVYAGFTDIEFNPAKSVSCQARSCALFVALSQRGLLDEALSSTERFVELVNTDAMIERRSMETRQPPLL